MTSHDPAENPILIEQIKDAKIKATDKVIQEWEDRKLAHNILEWMNSWGICVRHMVEEEVDEYQSYDPETNEILGRSHLPGLALKKAYDEN